MEMQRTLDMLADIKADREEMLRKTDANTTSMQEDIKANQAKTLAEMREERKAER
jgi:hypothetical protein